MKEYTVDVKKYGENCKIDKFCDDGLNEFVKVNCGLGQSNGSYYILYKSNDEIWNIWNHCNASGDPVEPERCKGLPPCLCIPKGSNCG